MLNQEPEYTRYLVDKNRRVSQVLQEIHGRPGEEETYTSFLYGLGRIGYQPPIDTAGMFYYLSDALGSVRQIADQSAAAVHQHSYSPFGVPRGGYLNHPKQQVSEAVRYNPYGFTGERHDTALGLVHLRTRDYQPEIGRFVRPDIFPGFLAQPLTLNRYGYVSNDPINLVDPLGMTGETDWAAVRAGLQIGISVVGAVAGVVAIVTLSPVAMTVGVIAAVFSVLVAGVQYSEEEISREEFLTGTALSVAGMLLPAIRLPLDDAVRLSAALAGMGLIAIVGSLSDGSARGPGAPAEQPAN